LLDREPPLLVKDSGVWHKPRREPGGLAEAGLFAFLRGRRREKEREEVEKYALLIKLQA
jgi:hypothetical protein